MEHRGKLYDIKVFKNEPSYWITWSIIMTITITWGSWLLLMFFLALTEKPWETKENEKPWTIKKDR